MQDFSITGYSQKEGKIVEKNGNFVFDKNVTLHVRT